jgi:alkylated DNA nucleotide flippase Atl1
MPPFELLNVTLVRAGGLLRPVTYIRGTPVRGIGYLRRRSASVDAGLVPADELPDFAADVLDVVERIPPGRVMTYGDVAEYLGQGGPRQVGQVMARWGGPVPWWRVLRADGSPAPGHERRALWHFRSELTPMRPGGDRVDLRRARWNGAP